MENENSCASHRHLQSNPEPVRAIGWLQKAAWFREHMHPQRRVNALKRHVSPANFRSSCLRVQKDMVGHPHGWHPLPNRSRIALYAAWLAELRDYHNSGLAGGGKSDARNMP